MLNDNARCLLIGGTSNIGKSTLATAFGEALGWPVLSTDSLARHPGRPWPTPGRPVPPQVAEHYGTLSVDELIDSVLTHYRNVWPLAERLVRVHAAAPLGRLVLEGSALWPDQVASLDEPRVAAIWLTGSAALIDSRIRRESGYETADTEGKRLIEQFIARSQRYDVLMRQHIAELGLPAIEIENEQDIPALLGACRERAAPLTRT